MNIQTMTQMARLGNAMGCFDEPAADGGIGGGGDGGNTVDLADNGGGDGTNEPQAGADGAEPGDQGLDEGDSLIVDTPGGDDKPKSGDESETPPAEPPKEEPVTDEAWLGGVKFTEEIGKDADGNAIAPNVEALKAVMPALREAGITSEQASAIATAWAKYEMGLMEAHRAEQEAAYAKQSAALKVQCAELKRQTQERLSEEDIMYANRAMTRLKESNPTFYKTVRTSFLGVHPDFMQMAAALGRMQGDDGVPGSSSSGGQSQEKTRGSILFANEIKAGLAR